MEAADTSSDEDEVPVLAKEWSKKDPGLVGTKIPEYVKPELSEEDKEMLQSLHTAYDFYKVFSPDSYINEVVHQSRLYAVQKGHEKQLNSLTKDKIRYVRKIYTYIGTYVRWYVGTLVQWYIDILVS